MVITALFLNRVYVKKKKRKKASSLAVSLVSTD